MNFTTQRIIVPFGNYAMQTGGLPLFVESNPKPGRKIALNGVPGQPVAYTFPVTGGVPVTVATADIPALKTDVFFGIFTDPDGDGFATEVQHVHGESLTSCLIDKIYAQTPDCGSPAIKAVTIDCVKCRESYVARVAIRDSSTMSYSNVSDKPEEFFVTHHTQCNSCDDCSEEANCKDIANGLVDELNSSDELKLGDSLYPDYKRPEINNKRFRAVVGHSNWKTYCITPDAGSECKDCYQVDKIVSATINGELVTFNRNTNPAALTKTLLSQLEVIAEQIEDAFTESIGKHSGFAVVTRGVTPCCAIQLHVITCDETFELTDVDDCDLGVDMTFSPATAFADCVTPAQPDYIPPCWIAIIAAPPVPSCETCDLNGPMPYYGIDIDIDILKDASSYSPISKKKTLLEARSPINFGLEIKWLQYKYGFPGGRGRDWNTSNPVSGQFGMPDSTSRLRNAVTAKCGSQYCTVTFENSKINKTDYLPSIEVVDFKTTWAFDTKDTVTIASVVPFLNALVTKSGGACKVLSNIAC